MADELDPIFERAALDMRPEFEARLRTLLLEERGPELRLVANDGNDTIAVDVDHNGVPDPRPGGRRWWPLLLVAAATLVLFVAVARRPAPTPAPATLPPSPNCAESAETIGSVPATDLDIRIGIMPDGRSFCLADDGTGAAIRPISLIGASEQSSAPVDKPTITFRSTIDGIASVWVVAIPEGMPAEFVSSPDVEVSSFPSRVGRRLLVIHPIGKGPEPTAQSVLQIFSGRDLLATLAIEGSEEPP